MKSLEEVREYFYTSLVYILEPLEKKRRQTAFIVLLLYLSLAFVCVAVGVMNRNIWVLPGVLLFSFIAWLLLSDVGFVSLENDFKREVIGSLIRFIEPGLTYKPGTSLHGQDIQEISLFHAIPNDLVGEGRISGEVNGVKIDFCNVTCKDLADRKKNTKQRIAFDGIFFRAKFNKDFVGRVVVFPDIAQVLLGSFGEWLHSNSKEQGELIKLEDPEFERLFVVYGDDQVKARYVLSPHLMLLLVEFQKKFNEPLYMGFINGEVQIALMYIKNEYKLDLFKTLMTFGPIEKYYQDLKLMFDVVEDLKLNVKIWG